MGNFYINKEKILENYKKYKKIGAVYFPLKTNSNEEIISFLDDIFDETDKFAISHKGHLKSFINNMSLINPLFSLKDYEYFYEKGVRDFVFDNINIYTAFKKRHNDITCSARINIGELYKGTKTPIGATLTDVSKMVKSGCSLSIYCPKEIRTKDFVEEALILAKVLSTKTVRIGGIDNDFNMEIFTNFKLETGIEIITEPGTGLMEGAIDYKCEIVDIRRICGKNYIILDATLYSMMLDHILYNKDFDIYVDDKKLSYKDNMGKPFIICGRSSDYKDVLGNVFINNGLIEKIKTERFVTFKNVGAYFESLENQYFKF